MRVFRAARPPVRTRPLTLLLGLPRGLLLVAGTRATAQVQCTAMATSPAPPSLVSAQTLRLLHAPVIATDPAAQPSGSNAMNLARIWVDPDQDLALVLATNAAGPRAQAALEELAPQLAAPAGPSCGRPPTADMVRCLALHRALLHRTGPQDLRSPRCFTHANLAAVSEAAGHKQRFDQDHGFD